VIGADVETRIPKGPPREKKFGESVNTGETPVMAIEMYKTGKMTMGHVVILSTERINS